MAFRKVSQWNKNQNGHKERKTQRNNKRDTLKQSK